MFPRSVFPGNVFPTLLFPDGFFQAVEAVAGKTHRRRRIMRQMRKLRWDAWVFEADMGPLVRKEREDSPKVKPTAPQPKVTPKSKPKPKPTRRKR